MNYEERAMTDYTAQVKAAPESPLINLARQYVQVSEEFIETHQHLTKLQRKLEELGKARADLREQLMGLINEDPMASMKQPWR